jgi:hypothetical protein
MRNDESTGAERFCDLNFNLLASTDYVQDSSDSLRDYCCRESCSR